MAAEMEYIAPDGNFVKQIINLGGKSLKKCFQCGSCSVVCSLSPYKEPFPRKEMIWTQWGLKDRLLKDPDVWLCHNCNDCSTYCPRGAKPSDVLVAIRNYSILHFALPNFLAKSFSRFRYLLFILAILVFMWFLPITYAPIAFFIVGGLVFIVAAIGIARFWKNISESESKPASPHMGSEGSVEPVTQIKKGFLPSFVSSLVEILKHSNFSRCVVNKGSDFAHLLTFYGFIFLVISHFGDQIYPITGAGLPLPLTNPLKIVGNFGALALFYGLTLIIYRRLFKKQEVGEATYFDWFFIVLLYLVTITGIATELSRLAEAIALSHWLYLIHLAFLFALLAYFPFSKFAHLLYRTLAMTYAKQIGREAETEVSVETTTS
ncbi:MAG: quinone-interacting membrane-bound oxidoreductase complex subunit QmoC [bacterium]